MRLQTSTRSARARIVDLVLVDYAGAGARLALEKAVALDPRRWAWMPKLDGCYAQITTDTRGRIAQVLARSGASLADQAPDLVGLATGLPSASLAAELEAHSEAGVRARATRGYALAHVFDVIRWGGRYVARERAADRYALLHRWQAQLEQDGCARDTWWHVDDQGDAHDRATGRYARPVPRDLRRLPIVPLHRGRAAAEQLWSEHVERRGGEGIVAIRLDAPVGARGAKRKVKASDTLDALVLEAGGGVAILTWRGHRFTVSARGVVGRDLKPGNVVEVAHDGWYESRVVPRFARITRRRDDLRAAPPPAR